MFRSGAAVTIDNIETLQRENLVQEISELVHQQLVTTTLESTFRNVLEISMEVYYITYFLWKGILMVIENASVM